MNSKISAAAGLWRTRLALAGLVLFIFATWMLQHQYAGIAFNDSSLYSLLALARLHPESLPSDAFLRFGSQDRYTFFSPIFASVIGVLDLEPAAAVLTLFGHIAFFGCAWLLARRAMPARHALLAVGLLVGLPSGYGVDSIFSYVEDFLTPRQLTEALVLAGLASAAARRQILAGVCLLGAMLLHPIMALAGVVMLFCMYLAVPRPRLALTLAAALLAASLALVWISPAGPFAPFDATWLSLVSDSSPYLFVLQWPVENWSRIAVPVAILAVGALTSTNPLVRKLCCAALIMAVCSVALTLIYCDLLRVVSLTQLQPWRWLWLVEVISVTLLPVIVGDCWRAALPGRTVVVLLASAWLLRDYPVTLCIVFLPVSCAMALGRLTDSRPARLVFLGSCALLIIAIAANLAPKLSYLTLYENGTRSEPAIFAQWLRAWARDGVSYTAVLALSWWVVEQRNSVRSALFLAATATLACALVAPFAWQAWTDFHYTRTLRAAFAEWRDEIPPQAQVTWPGTPVGAWYLLERPSYYSIHQVAGDAFSRAKAIEIHRRADSIESALNASGQPPQQNRPSPPRKHVVPANADKLDARGLAVACADPELDFVVSWARLGPTPFDPVVPNPNKPGSRLHLYRCADLRS